MELRFQPYQLDFNFDAGTSRGVLKHKTIWLVKISEHPESTTFGIGEIAPLERLSLDYNMNMEKQLQRLAIDLKSESSPPSENAVYQLLDRTILPEHPSIRFGIETALLDLIHGGQRSVFNNEFTESNLEIPINGLIWMGEKDFMIKQIKDKLKKGFSCLKMKIGAIDFEQELEALEFIRKDKFGKDIVLRVDANGGFTTQECMLKMRKLEQFDLHSIEQPIMPKQLEAMSLLTEKTNIPIALDEELIGVIGIEKKNRLLDEIKPAYIVLKPGLLGGFKATKEWIKLAEEKNIGWWITSALESNIGLNAIAQFTAEYPVNMHQGLGTGQLFKNNIPSPLKIKGEVLISDKKGKWDFSGLFD